MGGSKGGREGGREGRVDMGGSDLGGAPMRGESVGSGVLGLIRSRMARSKGGREGGREGGKG